jgi:hypothetical protein
MNNVCVSKLQEEENKKLYDRNIPSQPLQPYLNVRPVMTKYSFLPIVDPRRDLSVPLEQMPTYKTTHVFNPGNNGAPWSGFASNINIESDLRNQIYALQKCSQSVYVPNSNSDLFDYSFKVEHTKNKQTHPLLFETTHFDNFNPNPDSKVLGSNLFMNNTRVQVRDLTKQDC